MARNITGWICSTFLCWSRGGWLRNRWTWHLGHNLIEKRGAWVWPFFLSTLAMPVWVLGETGLADYLGHFALYHAGDRMVQQEPAAGTIVVNQVAEPFCRNGHEITFRINLRYEKILQGL
jgi:hypothetical protein